MPRWVSVLVGVVLSPFLGLAAYGVSERIVSNMMRTCRTDLSAGESLIFVTLLEPALLTIPATAITYTVVHVLIERDWSIYIAVAAAVVVTAVMIVYAINSQFHPVPTELCPTGTPSWWPWQVTSPY